MKTIILVLLLMLPYSARAEWKTADTALQLGFTALTVVDWAQTVQIARNAGDGRTIETNRIMGETPHPDKVHLYMASAILGHALVSYLLDERHRRIWQCIGIGVELASVGRNWSMGIQARF